MSSQAIQSVVTFLTNYPPFSFIATPALYQLATHSQLRFLSAGEVVFEENTVPSTYFYVVKKGKIQLTQSQQNTILLIDECATGDIFGVRAIFAADTYLSTATAQVESLIFQIPIEIAQPIVNNTPKVALYFASIFAMGMSANDEMQEKRKARKFLAQKSDWLSQSASIDTIQVQANQAIVICKAKQSIKEAAQLMSQHRVGSLIVIDDNKKPKGIITDTDLRNKVVAKGLTVELPVTHVMSSPVLTIPTGLSLLEIMLIMTAHKVSHLCITKDGSAESEVLGVVSQRDLLLLQGNNPAIIAKQISKSEDVAHIAHLRNSIEQLTQSYLFQELAIPLISNIVTEINDTLIEKAVQLSTQKLAAEGLEMPSLRFCWLSLGSEGRKEQLLRTDQDNALIYEDAPNETLQQAAKSYFLKLASCINQLLIDWGFAKCPADMMASNPKWCQPLSQWKNYFEEWISVPDEQALMHTTIFFDFRPVAGSSELAEELRKYIYKRIEKNGEHKDLFDIKARAMMPLADAACVLMLEFQLPIYGITFERFEAVGKLDANLKDICESAALAYEIFIKHRAISGFQYNNDGRFINPKDFNKLEKQILKNAFDTISKLQKIMEVRYQLNYIR